MLTTEKGSILGALKSMCKVPPRGMTPENYAALLDQFAGHMSVYFVQFEINTHKRIAMFLAHAMHECGMFRVFEENLNYNAAALTRSWPNRFPPDVAAQYANQKKKIANRAYANRNGNKDEASGDGWKFRGRGIFQTTFFANYLEVEKAFPESQATVHPENLTSPQWATASACLYWKTRNINKEADNADMNGSTKKINGGTNGLEERANNYVKLIAM